MAKELARFRADPEKIRISVRRKKNSWVVKVSADGFCMETDTKLPTPVTAIDYLLKAARHEGIDGIDLDMQWAYSHPMYVNKKRKAK